VRLLLCRHAEAGNRAQTAELARTLADAPLAAVYTSAVTRALETARAVAAAHGLAPLVHEDLREIGLGDVEGLQFEEYPPGLQTALLTAPATVRLPGGESYEELRVRVVAALAEIVAQHSDATVAAISHAGAIRAALATWLEVGPEAAFRLDQSFAGINVVDWVDGFPFVRLVNGARLDR
jgi:broad specificity phosphatase PhoE